MDNNLDDINNKRVETTKKRVIRAIQLIDNPVNCLRGGRVIDNAMQDIAKAVNLLEAAEEEMGYACKHFGWNNAVCNQINDACAKLGICMTWFFDKDSEYYDPEVAGFEGIDAIAVLGKVAATLIRWFTDEQDVNEV